jgi:hypothetical protein
VQATFLWDRLAAAAPGALPPFLAEFAQPAAPIQPARLVGAHGPDAARPAAAPPATSAARAAAVLAVLAPLASSIIGREVRTPGGACVLALSITTLLHACNAHSSP